MAPDGSATAELVGPGRLGADEPALAIDARGITKVYGPTAALAGADLQVRPGEIHALLGENGAGKSTLVRLLAGVEQQDLGTIRLFGQEGGAAEAGCAFIHQDLAMFPTMSVAANIALGSAFPRRRGLIDDRAAVRNAQALLDRLGARFSPLTAVGELPLADQTAVAIARALSQGVRMIVLDEPTAYLEVEQVRGTLELLRRLRDDGVACLLITHRAADVLEYCDRITVLREGRTVATRDTAGLSEDALVEMISGTVPVARERRARVPASVAPILELVDAVGPGFGPVSLTVRPGEIVGLCGLADAGAVDLGRVAFGLERLSAGSMRISSAETRFKGPRRAIEGGVAYVPAQRRLDGLAEQLSARENLFLRPAREWFRPLRGRQERREAQRLMRELGVYPAETEHAVATFSGGNQQKIVLAKWLAGAPRLLVLNEPTAGVDLHAKAEIHRHIATACQQDAFGALLISSDFKEISELADRVYVMHRRVVCAELGGADASPERLITAAYGKAAA